MRTPLLESEMPVGKEPVDTVHVNGVVPPRVARVWEYGAPTIPAGSAEVATDRAATTVTERALVTVCGVGLVVSVEYGVVPPVAAMV